MASRAKRWHQGPIAGFDVESTGVSPFQDRIVQYALIEREEGGSMRKDINLVNPGCSIPPGATAIHGICDDDVADAMPVETATAIIVAELLDLSERGVPLIGMNLSYDLSMVDVHARDYMQAGLVDMGWHGPVVDLMIIDRQYDRYRKGGRKLTDLCEHYGVAPGEAHDAGADVYAVVRCVLALVKAKPAFRTQSIEELWRLQPHWSWEQKRSLSDYFVKQGRPALTQAEMGWPIYGMNCPPPD